MSENIINHDSWHVKVANRYHEFYHSGKLTKGSNIDICRYVRRFTGSLLLTSLISYIIAGIILIYGMEIHSFLTMGQFFDPNNMVIGSGTPYIVIASLILGFVLVPSAVIILSGITLVNLWFDTSEFLDKTQPGVIRAYIRSKKEKVCHLMKVV